MAGDAFASVAVDVPLDSALSYRVPAALRGRVVRGVRVLVPFRQRARSGVVLSLHDSPPDGFDADKIRPIADVLDTEPAVPDPQLEVLEWVAQYYHAPVGECVRLALPSEAAFQTTRAVERTGAPRPEGLEPLAAGLADVLTARDTADGPIPAEELVGAVPGARYLDVVALEAAGFARSVYGTEGTRVRTKTVDVIARTDRVTASRLGDQQLRILAWLSDNEPATTLEAQRELGVGRGSILALARRGLLTVTPTEVTRDPFAAEAVAPRTSDPPLTPAQEAGLEQIRDAEPGETFLIHGVTGSGKTELYLRVIRDALARGQRAVVLLPEIALTPQFVGVFRAALGDTVAVLHSGLSPGERFDQWRRIRDGDVSVVIGARSALFAPVRELGVIVVDEEHDTSFKQHEGVHYHARDLAVVLAHKAGAVCLLGSATPSLESVMNARRGRYALVRMAERVADRPLPDWDIVDMRHHPADEGDPVGQVISPPLQLAVRETVDAGEQAILFLNRRGFAPTMQCTHCGEVLDCPDCDVSVTWHRGAGRLKCHYCGFTARKPDTCPTCGALELEPVGAGTEHIEHVIDEAFRGMRVARLDRDTSRGKGLMRVLGAFRAHEIDVLVGTQMVTKGHDFPAVTLVGVIDADQSLRFPDFRSGERTYQLLTQVAGRAGRGDRPGRVIVQTYRPDHFVIEAVRSDDFEAYAERELRYRKRMAYPPYGYVAVVRLSGPTWDKVSRIAQDLERYLQAHVQGSLKLLGPVDAPIARIRTRYRMQILLRDTDRRPLHHAVKLVLHRRDQLTRDLARDDVRVSVDVDPMTLL